MYSVFPEADLESFIFLQKNFFYDSWGYQHLKNQSSLPIRKVIDGLFHFCDMTTQSSIKMFLIFNVPNFLKAHSV